LRTPRLLIPLLLGTLLFSSAAGCQKQLFPEDEPRSQYDRFDTIRDRRAPRRVENALGESKVNLRGRLLTPPE
jgi:hypothetical protein